MECLDQLVASYVTHATCNGHTVARYLLGGLNRMLLCGIYLYLQHLAFVNNCAGTGVGFQSKDHVISTCV